MPRLRYSNRYSFRLLSSTQAAPGTYVTTMVPKSGWPVLGQTAVNSGQVISISYSRSGNWFGKVSSGGGINAAPGPDSTRADGRWIQGELIGSGTAPRRPAPFDLSRNARRS